MADPKPTTASESGYQKYLRRETEARRGPSGSATLGGLRGPEALAAESAANRPPGEISAPARPNFGQQMVSQVTEHPVQTAMEVGGAMAGAGVGGLAGRYFVGAIGRKLLAQQGARGAEVLGRIGGRLLGSGAGMLAGSEAAMGFSDETPEETLRRRAATFGAGMGGELGAGVLQRLTRPVSAGVRRGIVPITEEPIKVGAREVTDALGRIQVEGQPGRLSVGQTLGGGYGFLENLAKASITGGGTMIRGVQQFGRRSAAELWDQTVKAFGGKATPEQAGQVLKDALDQMPNIQRAYTRGTYGALDLSVAGAGGAPGVELAPVLAETRTVLQRVLSLNPPDPDAVRILGLVEGGVPIQPGSPARASSLLGPGGQPAFVTPGTPARPLPVNFADANEIRSYLDGIARRDDLPIPGIKARAGFVARRIDGAIDDAMRRLGPLGQDVLDKARIARESAKFGKDTFNEGLIKEMLDKVTPEELTSLVLSENAPTRLNTLYELLGNPRFAAAVPDRDAMWKLLQGAWIENTERSAGRGPVAEAVLTPVGSKPRLELGELDGAELMNQARRSGSTVSALFRDPAERRALMIAGHAIDMAQNPGGSRTGTLFIGMRQASELSNLMMTGTEQAAKLAQLGSLGLVSFGTKGVGASAFVLGLPWALARALASPKASEVLLRHAEAKGSRAGFRSAQIAALTFSRALAEAGIPHWVSDPNGQPVEIKPYSSQPSGAKPQSKF